MPPDFVTAIQDLHKLDLSPSQLDTIAGRADVCVESVLRVVSVAPRSRPRTVRRVHRALRELRLLRDVELANAALSTQPSTTA